MECVDFVIHVEIIATNQEHFIGLKIAQNVLAVCLVHLLGHIKDISVGLNGKARPREALS